MSNFNLQKEPNSVPYQEATVQITMTSTFPSQSQRLSSSLFLSSYVLYITEPVIFVVDHGKFYDHWLPYSSYHF